MGFTTAGTMATVAGYRDKLSTRLPRVPATHALATEATALSRTTPLRQCGRPSSELLKNRGPRVASRLYLSDSAKYVLRGE